MTKKQHNWRASQRIVELCSRSTWVRLVRWRSIGWGLVEIEVSTSYRTRNTYYMPVHVLGRLCAFAYRYDSISDAVNGVLSGKPRAATKKANTPRVNPGLLTAKPRLGPVAGPGEDETLFEA